MAFDVNLYRAHLYATTVSHELLQAHTRKEYCSDDNYAYHIKHAEQRLSELAAMLGFRIERVIPAPEIAA
jgi:hypothetical protein